MLSALAILNFKGYEADVKRDLSGGESATDPRLPARCIVAMEACGGAHFWGREIGRLGHEVRLIPPAYVKPFVKGQKNGVADAEAICEPQPGLA